MNELMKARKELYNYCSGTHCDECPINIKLPDHSCGRGASYKTKSRKGNFKISDREVEIAYEIAFGQLLFEHKKISIDELHNFLGG